MDGQKNQGVFVTNCFIAAGSKRFALPKYKNKQTSDNVEYQRMIYKGDRQITEEMKRSFPHPFGLKGLSDFFCENIREAEIRRAMTEFAIPVSIASDQTLFSRAIAAQFQALIQSDSDDVDDIVAMEYQKFLTEPYAEEPHPMVPTYPGDSAFVLEFQPARAYTKKCYDRFDHTWVIRNAGNQMWRNRKLVFVNQASVKPRADTNCIVIPDTSPGKDIKITTSFDARGSEGHYESLWVMLDSEGNDCFPNNNRLFAVTIDVKFEVM